MSTTICHHPALTPKRPPRTDPDTWKGRYWKRTEIDTLLAMIDQGRSYEAIARHLGRTKEAVMIKAERLNYRRKERKSYDESHRGMRMRILGLDPGTTKPNPTGVALLTWTLGDEARLLGTAHLAPTSQQSLASFLGDLAARLRTDWLNQVDLLGIEWPFVGKNAQSALDLAACCGAVLSAAGERGIACVLISPAEGKLALAGTSSASKQAMIDAVRLQFRLAVPKDHADAVGIALAARATVLQKGLIPCPK